MTFKVYAGICRGGPMNGKTHAEMNKRRVDISVEANGAAPAETGFYIHYPATGAKPDEWRWVATKGKNT